MKSNYMKFLTGVLLTAIIPFAAGCEFDVAKPQWENDFTEPAEPVITEIIPADAAIAGVNTITINGQNFATAPDINDIYFNNVKAENLTSSASSIVVRRPNIAADECVIKVVSSSALVVVKHEPYRVDKVVERYGDFIDNIELSVLTEDDAGNLYVIETDTRNIIKYLPGGEKVTIGTASRPAYDAVIGPDGRMYIAENNRAIDVVDLQTGTVERWVRLPSGRVVHHGDFDNEGYYYCGGRRSRLVIVAPDEDQTVTDTDEEYRSDEIMGVRVFDGYVYLLVLSDSPDEFTPEWAVWRNQILGNGAVGEKELVLDLSKFSANDSTSLDVTSFNFSSDGKMYLSVNDENTLVVYDMASDKMDHFYKGILPGYCKYFNWGNSTSIYMITGNSELGEEWTVYKVDMGITGY